LKKKKETETSEKKEDSKKSEESKPEEKNVKGVPEFWLVALKHHEDFTAMITEADEQALKHLIDMRIAAAPEHSPESFTIEFYFSDNEFFDNKVIKKTYILKESPVDGEMMYDHVESTDIAWKPNKNLTVKKVTKQQKKKGAKGRGGKGGSKGGPTQSITVEEPTESFFYFFTPEAAYAVYGGAEEDQDDEFDDGGLGEFLELDYELGLELQEKVIPHAVMFFTGENIGEEEDDEEEEDEDDEAAENDEDEDEEEEFEPPKEAANTTSGGQPQNPECKQQ